ncbi:uncharacterized protein EI90DRAFT_178979 [Cantharellus anzutake]|uniref:uncharacterized protein n=1 Tax=Cantharellus anzutake TaxID=1750568 RepID=UPI001905B1BF|nr:uncharacterized protein EI90DRAFT_178979 [Cantharellus anzutake]KAF8336479.1 hypothetical protein EI90DRAFT_178979 [Cantharellus anzutake]
MSSRSGFLRFSERRHSSKRPGGPPQPSTPAPNLQITPSPTANDATTNKDRDGSDGSRLQPPTSSTAGSSRGRKQRRSVWYAIAQRFSRSPSPDPTHIDQPKSSYPRQSDPSRPDPPSPDPSPSHILAIDASHTIPNERIIHGNTESPATQPGLTGADLDIPSSMDQTSSSSAVPAGDRKKTIIAATRLVLQTAASALKFVPIPNLDQIPSILLTWLQVYETIDNNDENLKGLDNEVRKAHETIFRPLLLWTGQVPPEIATEL